ncbi:MAG: DUF58 domain-containing protein [Solirubrobacteraceae bacterium]
MTGTLSPRVRGLMALAGAAMVTGLAGGRPELVVVVVPLLVLVGVALAVRAEPRLSVAIAVDRVRLIEGENVTATVLVRNDWAALDLEVTLIHTPYAAVEPAGALMLRLDAGRSRSLTFAVRPQRWGAHTVGPLAIRARDPLGMRLWEGRLGTSATLRSFPREQRLRELVAPLRTQPFLGAHVARVRGSGIEFADIRPFASGDRVRHVNWRATARRGALYVTERHPEHASDVVLLLDTFAEARDGASGTLDGAVRAAASLARAHLARRDRVALVDFGGTLHWLEPAFGTSQLYRIVDALLASDIALSYAWRAVESIPRKLLPPGALVLAITPLLDPRSISLITDLRTRGRDLTVVEVSPIAHTPSGPRDSDHVAYRLWTLQRAALRTRLRAMGIAVAMWDEESLLAVGLEGVNAFRRSAGLAAHA